MSTRRDHSRRSREGYIVGGAKRAQGWERQRGSDDSSEGTKEVKRESGMKFRMGKGGQPMEVSWLHLCAPDP
jgi:hypothetical protein